MERDVLLPPRPSASEPALNVSSASTAEIFLELRKFSRFPKIINGAAVRNSGAIAQAAATGEEGDFFQLSRRARRSEFYPLAFAEIVSCSSFFKRRGLRFKFR